jgi:hypothetical protein
MRTAPRAPRSRAPRPSPASLCERWFPRVSGCTDYAVSATAPTAVVERHSGPSFEGGFPGGDCGPQAPGTSSGQPAGRSKPEDRSVGCGVGRLRAVRTAGVPSEVPSEVPSIRQKNGGSRVRSRVRSQVGVPGLPIWINVSEIASLRIGSQIGHLPTCVIPNGSGRRVCSAPPTPLYRVSGFLAPRKLPATWDCP